MDDIIENSDIDAKLSTNLEQWQAFVTVVDAGGYSAAAQVLGKSQSSISYAVSRLETALGLALLRLKGRRAALTDNGQLMYRRAKVLLEETVRLEQAATKLAQGWEARISVGVDIVFPVQILLGAIRELCTESQASRVEIRETALSGTDELLLRREVDLVVAGKVPGGFLGESLGHIPFVPVVSREHALAQATAPISEHELRSHRQVVVRDSGTRRRVDSGWLRSEQRLTVSHFRSSLEAIGLGIGFAWLPLPYVQAELSNGSLRELPLKFGGRRQIEVFLIYADRETMGHGVRRLGDLIKERARLAVA